MKGLTILAIVGAMVGMSAAASGEFNLLPKPASVKMTEGVYTIPDKLILRVTDRGAAVTRTAIERKGNIRIESEPGEGWRLVAGDVRLPDAPKGEEAYRLTVTPKGIALVASAEAGFRHGVRTLVQLLATGKAIPACEIDDYPALSLRGIMVCDGRIVAKGDDNYYRRLVEEVAAWKMNAFLFHFSETGGCWLELKSHPEVVNVNHMSQEDAKRLVARASELGVWVIPEVESWGHANWMLKSHPELGEGGGQYTFCLSKEEIYTLLEDVIKEVSELFPGPYIHLGCDEAQFAVDDPCKAKAAAIGADRMIAEHLNRLNRIAKKYGKTSIIWGDVILRNHRDAIKYLDPDIVIVDWNYRPEIGPEGLRWLKESGFKTLAAPAVTFSAWSIAPNWSNLENIRVFAGHAKAEKSLGIETTIWGGERILPGSAGPAFAWMCDQSWNPGGQDYKASMAAYLFQRFGLEPTPKRVDTALRLFDVGVLQNRLDLVLWSDASTLVRNNGRDIEEYGKPLKGLAKALAKDLGRVKFNRDSYMALVVTAAVGEHTALRRATAVEVVKLIEQAEADTKSDKPDAARSNLRKAAESIRRMEEKHAELLPRVKEIWQRDYGPEQRVWWFTKPEAHEYAKQLASKLDELAESPDAQNIAALIEVKK